MIALNSICPESADYSYKNYHTVMHFRSAGTRLNITFGVRESGCMMWSDGNSWLKYTTSAVFYSSWSRPACQL